MSSLQPSVPPGLPADPAAQACQSDMGRHRCARFSLMLELGGSSSRPVQPSLALCMS